MPTKKKKKNPGKKSSSNEMTLLHFGQVSFVSDLQFLY